MAALLKVFDLYTAPLAVSILSAIFLICGILIIGSSSQKFANLPFGIKLVALPASFSLVFWGIRGFEVSLIFMLTAYLYVMSEKKYLNYMNKAILFLVILFGVWTRDDFAVFILLLSSFLLLFKFILPSWIKSGWSFLLLLLVSLPIASLSKIAFRLFYFSDIVPNTYFLKVYGHDKIAMLLRGILALQNNFISVFAPISIVLVILFLSSKDKFINSLMKSKEIDSHLIAFVLLLYSVSVGGDAWENVRVINRFSCISLPFIFLNYFNFLNTYEDSSATPCTSLINRQYLPFKLITYSLSLPVWLVIGYYYQVMLDSNSSTVAALAEFDKRAALLATWDWLLLGLCIFVIPIVLESSIDAGKTKNVFKVSLLSSVAIFSLFQPLSMVAMGELSKNHSILLLAEDAQLGRDSILSRKFIPSGSKVASLLAGIYPYYRPDVDFVDPLGKMDEVIARTSPRWPFYPGHTKWNWDYTLLTYKPDFVVGNLNHYKRGGRWADNTLQWERYFQLRDGIIKRKNPK